MCAPCFGFLYPHKKTPYNISCRTFRYSVRMKHLDAWVNSAAISRSKLEMIDIFVHNIETI